MQPASNPYRESPGTLIKRLMAILYDSLLLLAILFIVSAFAIALNHGNAIRPSHPAYPYYVALLLIIAFVFFGWFWTHGGQTLGMKTWKLQLVGRNGAAVSWKQSLLRFCFSIVSWAALGLGFLWSIVDPQKRAWHDIASGTRLLPAVKREQPDESSET